MSDLAVSRAAHSPPTKGRPKAYHAVKPPSLSFATAVVQSGLNYILLILGSGAFLLPFYFIVNGSLKSNEAVQAGEIIRPPNEWSQIRWSNYPQALSKERLNFSPALANTVVITTCCVVGQVISCSLVGFGFARFRFRGKSILFMVMLATMMLPTQVTMIPVFLLFKMFHMVDSFWPLILPAWLASPFFVFMFRQFFARIPEELVEAARIDGAGNARIYWQIMLPLCRPAIAIVAIYTFLSTWNDFLGPLVYLNSPDRRTLALALTAFNGQYGPRDTPLLMAASVVCMLPCILLFFVCQKYFVEGVANAGFAQDQRGQTRQEGVAQILPPIKG
jgi:multiple sugar transport system permease protein